MRGISPPDEEAEIELMLWELSDRDGRIAIGSISFAASPS